MKRNRIISILLMTFMMFSIINVTSFSEKSRVHADSSSSFVWPSFRGNNDNNAVVDYKTPTIADDAVLYWGEKKGDGYESGAIGVPIIIGDYLVFRSGKYLFKMDRFSGKIVATSDEMRIIPSHNIEAPTYAEGKIFVALSGGNIQCFDAETLKSLWIYSDSVTGHAYSPIVYNNGYIYTGFWIGETGGGEFVCLSVEDEDKNRSNEPKLATWKYNQDNQLGGFYWAGAYVNDDFLLVGTDDKDDNNDGIPKSSNLLSLDPETGVLLDKISNLNGDIRSSISYDNVTDRYYFTSKGGSFYSVSVDSSAGNKGKFIKNDDNELYYKEIELVNANDSNIVGMSTSTPVVHNGRAYVGVSGTGQFTQYSGHNLTVIDLASWTTAYQVKTQGYLQTSGLLTTSYESADGYAYVYFVENRAPGKIRFIKDKPGLTSLESPAIERYNSINYECAPVLFTPVGEMAEYAICSLVSDEYGTLYFKNDSAHMMAVGSMITGIEVTQKPNKTTYNEGEVFDPSGMQVYATLKNGLKRDVTKYVTYPKNPVSANDKDVTISYDYVQYGDNQNLTISGNRTNVKAQKPNAYIDINVNKNPAPKSQTISGASSFLKAYNSKAFNLGAKASGGGKLTYKSSNNKVATVSSAGKVTIKGMGMATITINAAAVSDKFKATNKKVVIKVAPKKVSGLVVKSNKKKIDASWKKDSKATGYQIAYSTNKNFKKNVKHVNISKNKTVKKSLKGVKVGKTYFVKVRAYKQISGKKIFAPYSAIKKIRVK